MHVTDPEGHERTRWDCDTCGHPQLMHRHRHDHRQGHRPDHRQDTCGVCACAAYRRTWLHVLMDWISN